MNDHGEQLTDELLELIDLREPFVRPDVVAAARARIDLGEQPTAAEVADLLLAVGADEWEL